MTPRAAITRATIAAAVALLVAMLKAFGIDVPDAIADNLVEVGAFALPLALGVWYTRRARQAANARPTEGDAPDAIATSEATPSDPVAIAEGDAALASPGTARPSPLTPSDE
ncbi:hypothetical protein [Micromonospora sp. NPDC047730]|uniref:hypothetical protein n=1 Tax=Micromonospora sp. NPDC047730 TaxID=3364253 RepID=UPI003717D06A